MRLAVSAVCVVLAFTGSCGYIGPVVPPSPEIPVAVINLSAVERGDQLQIAFTTPVLTTDFLPVKRLESVEVRIGPAVTPFDSGKWEQTSKRYPSDVTIDRDDPKPVAVNLKVPVSDWQGQKVSVAVRTATKTGNHMSQWSPPVTLDVIEPLKPPTVKVEATREGYKLAWNEDRPGLHYDVLRQGRGGMAPEAVGVAENSEFVDTTSQWDTPYTYFVVAKIDTAESLRSEGVAVNHPDTFAPMAPGGVAALAGPDSIELSWSRSPEADFKAYRIYRSVGTGPFEQVGNLTNLPTFSDRKVERGKTYRYAVTAIDQKNNESEKSSVAEVAF